MSTGIFFYYQQGERLRDFPEALNGVLDKDHVFFYDAFYPQKLKSYFDLEPIPIEALRAVHSNRMIERVKATGEFEGALYSAAGTVAAAIRVWSGEITNAFAFTGYGDHHAGRDFFGGGCYFNGAAIAIHELQEKSNVQRLAIVDTDAHHGDGTWDLFENDGKVLYICFCPEPSQAVNQKVNIQVPWPVNDEDYLALVEKAFERYLRKFQPEMLFWNWGYDGTAGEYGDMGLTPTVHWKLGTAIKRWAREICQGRLIVILCGGSRRDLARILIPKMIKILAGLPAGMI